MINSPTKDSFFSGVFSNKFNNLIYNFSVSFKLLLFFSNFALMANKGNWTNDEPSEAQMRFIRTIERRTGEIFEGNAKVSYKDLLKKEKITVSDFSLSSLGYDTISKYISIWVRTL